MPLAQSFLGGLNAGVSARAQRETQRLNQSIFDLDKRRYEDELARRVSIDLGTDAPDFTGGRGPLEVPSSVTGPVSLQERNTFMKMMPTHTSIMPPEARIANPMLASKTNGQAVKDLLAKRGGYSLNEKDGSFGSNSSSPQEGINYLRSDKYRQRNDPDPLRSMPSHASGQSNRYGNAPAPPPLIESAMKELGMTDPNERAAFLATTSHETGGFTMMHEGGKEDSNAGAKYEGRKDLGNTQPGDGKRYKGRGFIQLTGRYNYRVIGKAIGVDLENHPELAANPDIAAKVAVAFWQQNVDSIKAANGDFRLVTHSVNGGYNGYDKRLELYRQYGGKDGPQSVIGPPNEFPARTVTNMTPLPPQSKISPYLPPSIPPSTGGVSQTGQSTPIPPISQTTRGVQGQHLSFSPAEYIQYLQAQNQSNTNKRLASYTKAQTDQLNYSMDQAKKAESERQSSMARFRSLQENLGKGPEQFVPVPISQFGRAGSEQNYNDYLGVMDAMMQNMIGTDINGNGTLDPNERFTHAEMGDPQYVGLRRMQNSGMLRWLQDSLLDDPTGKNKGSASLMPDHLRKLQDRLDLLQFYEGAGAASVPDEEAANMISYKLSQTQQ